jgi:hypothetical protein
MLQYTRLLSDAKYPTIEVGINLTGPDGNAFAIIGRVRKALKLAGIPSSEIEEFTTEATAGDYEDLLRVCCMWVTFRSL